MRVSSSASAKPFMTTSMMGFGAFLARQQGLGSGFYPGQHGVLGRVLPALFALNDLLRTTPQEPLLRDFWMPGVEVMIARSPEGSVKGLFLAAQGGHNAESHNHNDVGNFIVYADGEPRLNRYWRGNLYCENIQQGQIRHLDYAVCIPQPPDD